MKGDFFLNLNGKIVMNICFEEIYSSDPDTVDIWFPDVSGNQMVETWLAWLAWRLATGEVLGSNPG